MNTKSLHINPVLPASFKNKFLAGFIIFCIFLNGFVPRFSLESRDYSVLSQIMKSQTALLQFFSFSSLPVKLVNDLFLEKIGKTAAHTKKLPENKNTNSSNSSVDYSLLGFDKPLNKVRSAMPEAGGLGTLFPAVVYNYANIVAPKMLDGPPGGLNSLLCFFIVFFFLLPRGNLDASALILSLKETFNPIPHCVIGFFLWLEHI